MSNLTALTDQILLLKDGDHTRRAAEAVDIEIVMPKMRGEPSTAGRMAAFTGNQSTDPLAEKIAEILHPRTKTGAHRLG